MLTRGGFTFGVLLFAFVVYTTLKGDLRGYLQVLGVVN